MARLPALPSLLGLRLVFALNGLGIAVWFPRIPDVKAALEVDLFTLALCFFMLPLGTMSGFFMAPNLVNRLGFKRMCAVAGPLFILFFIPPAFANSALLLGCSLFFAGLVIAPIEVAMNAKAGEVEEAGGKRIMSSCHAFWSLGSTAGALIGGGAAALGISFMAQQLVIAPIAAALAWWVAQSVAADAPSGADAAAHKPRLALPGKALVLVCVLPMGGLMIEGAMMEWSALFLRGDLSFGALAASVCYSGFALAMAGARLVGDGIVDRIGYGRIVMASSVMGALGLLLFTTAINPGMAFAGAVVLGLGIANIYPVAMSLAATTPGPSPQENIAIVAFTAFTVYLLGPPLIGFLGGLWGLPVALTLLMPLAIYPVGLVLWRAATFAGRPQTP